MVGSWDAGLAGVYISDMVISDRYIYVQGMISRRGEPPVNQLAELDLTTGELQSRVPQVGQLGFVRGMAGANGHVYFGSITETVWDFDEATREVTAFRPIDVSDWEPDYGFRTALLYISEGHLYGAIETDSIISDSHAVLYSYDLKEKKPRWFRRIGTETHHWINSC